MSSEGDITPVHERAAQAHGVEIRPQNSVSTRRQHIANMARKYAEGPLSTLSHHLDKLWMLEAFARVRRDSAPGVDGQTVEAFERDLERNLEELLEEAKSGRYRAPLVKRVHIPKSATETRPIGIPTTRNKVLERAIVMLLEPVYEAEFLDCSYGFRPSRSAHGALEAVRTAVMEMGGAWVVDVDVRKYFDTIPHEQLKEILSLRIGDGVIQRLVAKWLKAGVWEAGNVTYPEAGTPQGGVISPMLSNIYLHTVLDKWFEQQIKPTLLGQARLVRFADDFVMILQNREDAEAMMRLLPERFSQYGLTIHPEKTRLVDFRHPWKKQGKPETFDFLGFTHYWGQTRRGGYAVMRKTSKGKLTKALDKVRDWCKTNRHKPMVEQHKQLCAKLKGHNAYYGIRGNIRSLTQFRNEVERVWQYWLQRRSRGGGNMKWERFGVLLKGLFHLPAARIVHPGPTPQENFAF